MSKQNYKKFKELYEAEREAHQQTQQQLQNTDIGFIVFIKSRIKKFLNCFKIKNLDLFKNYKITKLKIVLPSLCLLFVVGLVYFFAFAEPADQLPQNQTFLNLAHSHINASSTSPTNYTSASTQTTQADFEQTGAGGFGYSATTTPNSVVGNADLGVYRSAPIDLGLKTKLANAVITKGGSARVFARNGNAASASPVEVKRTTTAEFDAGVVKTNINTADNMLKATATGGEGWDLSTASYDSVSFLVSGQDTNPYGIAFKSDGTKMYMVGYTNDKVHQYSLSTAWDLSTASYDSVSFLVSGQDTVPLDMAFKPDGTKMYMVGDANDKVFQYSLSTAWNLSTASYDSVPFLVSGQDTQPLSIAFKSDGTKMYMVGHTNKKVFQYSLSTAWNLSTASYDSVPFLVSGQDTSPFGIAFKSDGTKMYMVGATNDKVFQYSLSTAWNLSTASYDSVPFLVSGQDTSPFGIAFKSDGTKMYMVGATNDKVYQYSLSGTIYAAVSTFESDSLEISSSAQGDKLPIQANVPANTTLACKIKSSVDNITWSAWTATTSLATGLNLFDISALTGKYWQVGFDGTSDGSATWTMGGFSVVPKAANYSSLLEIINPADIQGLAAERYLQYLAFGDTTWNVNDVSLTSKFTAIDLGKRYNIDTLSLTDADDDLYRIHYSLQDENTYASTTQWIDAGDLTASTTLSHQFTDTNGKALRWFRFNRVSENATTPTNPQAKAFLAAQPGSALYKLWQGGSGGGFMTRYGSGTTGYYTINPPSTAIGTISASNEYRICNGTIAQTKDFIIKFLRQGDNDGYKIVQLSWDNTHWESYNGTSQTAGAVLDKNSAGYNSATLSVNTEGSCANHKTFYVRTNIPSTGINEGAKNVRFYFEAEGL